MEESSRQSSQLTPSPLEVSSSEEERHDHEDITEQKEERKEEEDVEVGVKDVEADISLSTDSVTSPSTRQSAPLICDELWTYTLRWSASESIFSPLKVLFLPILLYDSVGGPFQLFFAWPLWGLINSSIFACVFWARRPTLDPCLTTSGRWMNPCGSLQEIHYQESLSKLGENYLISPERMAAVIIGWSWIDLILTILNFGVSCALLLITFTDADGSIAQGWEAGYVVVAFSAAACGVSILQRVILMVYSIRYRCRAASKAAYEENTGGDVESQSVAPKYSPSQPMTLLDNRVRCFFFMFSCLMFLLCFIFLCFAFHDFLRAEFYLPDSVSSLHGDNSNERCDPMDPLLCLLPFPSSHFLEYSDSTATGRRVDIVDDMLPMLKRGIRYDASFSRLHDGFSVSTMLMWHLSSHIDSSYFVCYENINQSVSLNSTTLLINTRTMELHPHFTEKDYLDYDADKLSYITPASALAYNTTYIAVVKGLMDGNGERIPTSRKLHDYWNAFSLNKSTGEGIFDDRRFAHYENEIFPRLISLGINVSDVQLVWDFHTASEASLMHNLHPMYNKTTRLVQERIQSDKSSLYKKVSTHYEKCHGNSKYSSKMKKVHYTLNVPWYLDGESRIVNSLQRNKLFSSTTTPFEKNAKLLLQIPCSVSQKVVPATALMQVGHGLFWDRSFAEMSYITEQANQNGWILWSMDWRGLTRHDLLQFMRLLVHDMSKTGNYTMSALTQSLSDKLAGYLILQVILEGDEYKDLLKDSSFYAPSSPVNAPNPNFGVPPALHYVNSSISVPNYYFGVSLGAIMGAAWNAYSSIHLRSTLIAGGSLFTFILGRSDIFGPLKTFVDYQFYSRKDMRLGIQLMQAHLDACEASGWAHSGRYQRAAVSDSSGDANDVVPSILVQNGRGDSTVTAIAGRILASNLNASILSPFVSPRAMLPPEKAPIVNVSQNIFFQVLYKSDAESIPSVSKSTDMGSGTNVHKCIFQRDEIITQYVQYFNDNEVFQPICEDNLDGGKCIFNDHISCGSGL